MGSDKCFCDLAPGAMQPLEARCGCSATSSRATSRRAAATTGADGSGRAGREARHGDATMVEATR